MDFDARTLHQVATTVHVPLEEVVTVVTAALQDAYNATTAARADVHVHLDTASGRVLLLDETGAQVAPNGFGARATTAARQALTSWMRNLERVRKVGKWAQLEGAVVRGTVRAVTRDGEVRLDIDGTAAVLPAGEAIPGEALNPGMRMALLLLNANVTDRGTTKLTVSRRQPALVTALFDEHRTPRSARVQIVSVAREPGVRTKVAVTAADGDPVRELVGVGGSVARAVMGDLGGERVDIVEHSTDLTMFVAAALTPARPTQVRILEEKRREVIAEVPADQMAVAAGAHGVNLRLAIKLTGARIRLAPAES